jgi:HpiC1 cyclase/PEP-CTERM motif
MSSEARTRCKFLLGCFGTIIEKLSKIQLMKTNNKNKVLSVSAVAIFGLAVATTDAQPISVPNFSFETPSETGTYQDNSGITAGTAIPNTGNTWYYLGGFTASGSPVGVQDVSANGFTAGANPDGTQDGYVNVGAWMGSGALTTIAANTSYTLTVSEGNRGGGFAQTAGFTIALAYGSAVSTSLTSSSDFAASEDETYAESPAVGTFADYTINFTTGNSDADIGQSLFVLLGSDVTAGNNPIDYDNVRVTATSVPEPSALALAGGGLALLAFFRRNKS